MPNIFSLSVESGDFVASALGEVSYSPRARLLEGPLGLRLFIVLTQHTPHIRIGETFNGSPRTRCYGHAVSPARWDENTGNVGRT